MKRIACLLSFSLILLGAFHGVATAQQLDGNSDPLDKVKNQVKEEVDKAKDVTNEVEDSADNVVEDSSEVAEDAGGTAGSVADEPIPSDTRAPGSNDSRTKLTRKGSTDQSGPGSKGASGAEPNDTDNVAAAGNTIESAPENDEQLTAPEADADESEGSILSSTGAQILTWLVLACLLIAIGVALVRRRRTGSRA